MPIKYSNKVNSSQGDTGKMLLKYSNMMFQIKTNQIQGERESESTFQNALKTQSSFSPPPPLSGPPRLPEQQKLFLFISPFRSEKAFILLNVSISVQCHLLTEINSSGHCTLFISVLLNSTQSSAPRRDTQGLRWQTLWGYMYITCQPPSKLNEEEPVHSDV